MTNTNRTATMFIGAMLLLVMLGSMVPAVSAQGNKPTTTIPSPSGPPDHEKRQDGTVIITTDVVSIMANPQLPMFHFWFTADPNGTVTKFSLTYIMIVEFEDLNEDDTFQSNEVVHFASLAAYEWTVQSGSVVNNGVTTEVWVKYTKGGARTGGMAPGAPPGAKPGSGSVSLFQGVTLQIWAHIYLNDYVGNVTDDAGIKAHYVVEGGSELKMDIEIGNFPFSSEHSMVALQTLLRENEAEGPQEPNRHRYMTRERTRNNTGRSDVNWNSESGNETRFEGMYGTDVQRIDLADTSTVLGFFSWLDVALVTLPGGSTEAVNVTASYVPTGNGLAVYLSYPNFDGGGVRHDPSIGLYESAVPSTPFHFQDVLVMAALGILVVCVVVAAVRARRH
ncbi:MAG: hypothetical protein HXY34_09330 [Candidatus Thorarchaeota archaeon]|nr:hypothetical protein [Candidatus Thorarchaeota archaeon]